MANGIAMCLLAATCSVALLSAAAGARDERDIFGGYRNTYYYLTNERDYAQFPANSTILDLNNEVIAHVSNEFRRHTDIEGSGRLLDGRVVNYAGRVGGEVRYHVTRHPDGRGAGDCPLIPFRTIAVDPKVIPLGSLVKIEETVGMRLPDGTIHDGIWRAEDVGEAIRGRRIDLFIGDRDFDSILSGQGITHLQALRIRLVRWPAANNCATLDPT